MQKSLYFELTQKYFPQLVLSTVELLNDKNVKDLPYLYRDLLKKTYSADGRWASILANHSRITADVVALDSELPLKSRSVIEKVTGDIPKMGMKLYLTEKQMKDVESMIAQGLPETQIVERIFDDIPTVISGIYERIEDLFQSELSTGVGLAYNNVGTGVRIDVGYYNENKFGVSALWKTADAKCIDDIQKVVDKANDDANTITDCYADDAWLNAFYTNEQVRGLYGFQMNYVGGGANVPTLSLQQAQQLFLAQWGIRLHRVSRRFITEANGVKGKHTAWANGVCAFTCGEVIGDLAWTTCAETARPVQGVEYQTADEFILVSKYSKNDPLREFTSSQAMVIPVINDVDKIYLLDSTSVTA